MQKRDREWDEGYDGALLNMLPLFLCLVVNMGILGPVAEGFAAYSSPYTLFHLTLHNRG